MCFCITCHADIQSTDSKEYSHENDICNSRIWIRKSPSRFNLLIITVFLCSMPQK